MTCEHCGRPVAEGRAFCSRCDSERTAPEWTQSGSWRATAPRVSTSCNCASYAGVKVHAVGCPQALRDDAVHAQTTESVSAPAGGASRPIAR